MAFYSNLQQDELQDIADRYNLNVISYDLMEQGSANSNYLVNTDHGKYIFTIFEIELSDVHDIINVSLLLKKHGFPAPRIQHLANGETLTEYQGRAVLLKPYITGQVITDLDENQVSQIGAAMARLHELPTPDDLPKSHTYVLHTYPILQQKEFDQAYKSWLEERYQLLSQNIPSGLPVGLIHADMFADNVLFEHNQFKAILDFEHALQSYKVFDLGMAVAGLCTDDTKIAYNKVKALVSGYQQVRLLEENEKASLKLFIEYSALLTSAWRFWKYHIDAPNPEKADKYLQMVHLAKDADAIPNELFMKRVFA